MNPILRLGLLLALTATLIVGCGRRLPEEGAVAVAPTSVPTEAAEPAATEEIQEAAPETDTAEATEEVIVGEAAVNEEADAEEEAETEEETETVVTGDVALGQQVFNQQYDTNAGPWICASCHSVDEARTRLVGPGLWGLAELADERVAESGATDIVDYVHASIVNPQAYIAPAEQGGPYPENLMPANYDEVLTEEELDAVVAYVLSLQ